MDANEAIEAIHRAANARNIRYDGDAVYNLGQYTLDDMADILLSGDSARPAAGGGWVVEGEDFDGDRMSVWVDLRDKDVVVLGWNQEGRWRP